MQQKHYARLLVIAGMLTAAPAYAQVTGIITKSTAVTSFVTKAGPSFTFQSDGTDIGIESGSASRSSGNTFSATSTLDPDYISFKNGNVSSGLYAMTTSHTIVDITFMNDGAVSVVPKVLSTIVPAGLGMFIDKLSCLDRLTACGPANPITNPATFDSFVPGAGVTNLAGASFDFKITGGGQVLYDLAGGVTLLRDLGGNTLVTDLSDAQLALKGFRITSDAGSEQQFATQWDATNISIDFNQGQALDPGKSTTLRYETTVTTFTQLNCVTVPAEACLIAYSAFGDPIGRGGGVDPTLARGAQGFSALTEPGLVRDFIPSEDDLLKFGSFKFDRPVFKDGVLTFRLAGSVPEPATWAMMIIGFAFTGICMRRKTRAHAVSVV